MKGDSDTLNRAVMVPLFVVVAIDAIGGGVILPLLPFYSQHFGATPLVIGILALLWQIFAGAGFTNEAIDKLALIADGLIEGCDMSGISSAAGADRPYTRVARPREKSGLRLARPHGRSPQPSHGSVPWTPMTNTERPTTRTRRMKGAPWAIPCPASQSAKNIPQTKARQTFTKASAIVR